MKPVKSTDPRKRAVMEALKRKTGATRVTCVQERRSLERGVFSTVFRGHCLRRSANGFLERLGDHEVTAEEVSQLTGKGR